MPMMFLVVSLGMVAAAVPMAAAPPITTVRSPSPVFNPVCEDEMRQPPVPVKISIHMEQDLLWPGTLSVGASPPRFSLNESVELKPDCPRRGYSPSSRSIDVTISRQNTRYGSDGPSVMLNARYSRPTSNGICPVGTRQVSVDELIPVGKGSVTLEGDGGFRARLRNDVGIKTMDCHGAG